MFTHTPGPWAYDEKYVLRGSDGKRVGDLDKADTITEERYKQVMADRALKAAAPELLEALCALVLNIDAGGATLNAMKDARAAIAKATGQ